MPADQRVTQTLSATGQSNPVHGVKVHTAFSGTWVGTVKAQMRSDAGWVDTGDSWTAVGSHVIDGVSPKDYRYDFTRTSGSLVIDSTGAL